LIGYGIWTLYNVNRALENIDKNLAKAVNKISTLVQPSRDDD
jgi:hypothetical protein